MMDVLTYNHVYHMDFPDRIMVTGTGNPNARIAVVAGTPDASDEKNGYAFSGKSRAILGELLLLLGLTEDDVYATLAVKHRTLHEVGGVLVDRLPSERELSFALPYLMQELTVLSPKLVVALGPLAYQAIFGDERGLNAAHGEIRKGERWDEVALFHPSDVALNPEYKKSYVYDVIKLKKYCAEHFIR
ncbi:MAG: hypothetical protein IJF71_02170 [Clostridia bacterium]|nr:hypothetical protein [Clostridia bacterium]